MGIIDIHSHRRKTVMIESKLLISTVQCGYNWLRVWHEKHTAPPHLPQNALLLFQRFKKAYDSKDTKTLSSVISPYYQGDLFGVSSKQEYLKIQKAFLDSLPWGINPCLTIDVYSIIEETPDAFTAIIDIKAIATILGIPTVTYDSFPLRCKLSADQGWWRITEMFVEH
ncbi:MAG: hypothetical protein AAF329_11640 [Cyanobacteria bacterium P01_A01_bin.17]